MKKIYLSLCISMLAFAGCSPRINQENLMKNRSDFNSVVVRSWDEQMLLNLVRMRYRDNPMFLEVGNVISTQSSKTSGGINTSVDFNGDGGAGIGVNGERSITPTITYVPLQGEEFAKRLLTPVTPSTIFLLSQSGWSLERLMLCCVQQANGVKNAVTASGPTPEFAPNYETFQKLIDAIRILQKDRLLQIEMEKDGQSFMLYITRSGDAKSDSAAGVFKDLLGLDKSKDIFKVTAKRIASGTDEIALTGRSLLSVMFFLSQSVEVSKQHKEQGKVTVTKYEDGRDFDWNMMLGRVMRIQTSEKEPEESSVKVRYRDAWFFIADNDLTSKTTFNLLTFLFNLQAANKSDGNTVLTYPIR
ncbi:MAG: hypothetical protein ACOYNS_04330 [Bacteroidota bacterium]